MNNTIKLLMISAIMQISAYVFPDYSNAYLHSGFKESNFSIEKNNKAKILYTVDKEILSDFIFGSYRNPIGVIEGNDIHLFPNMKYILTKWCDLCRTEVISYGTYKVEGNRVIFNSDQKPNEAKNIRNDMLTKNSFSFYLYIDDCDIPKPILVINNGDERKKSTRYVENYLESVVGYLNWESHYSRLSRKITN